MRHKLGADPNEGHRTDVACNLQNDTNVSLWPTPARDTSENITTLTICCEQLGWVCSLRLAQSESVSKMRTCHRSYKKAQSCITFILPPSLFFMFTLQLLRTWRVVEEQPASRPPFPAFNFHHFTRSFDRNILSALFCWELVSVNLLVNKKLQFSVHPESHL